MEVTLKDQPPAVALEGLDKMNLKFVCTVDISNRAAAAHGFVGRGCRGVVYVNSRDRDLPGEIYVKTSKKEPAQHFYVSQLIYNLVEKS